MNEDAEFRVQIPLGNLVMLERIPRGAEGTLRHAFVNLPEVGLDLRIRRPTYGRCFPSLRSRAWTRPNFRVRRPSQSRKGQHKEKRDGGRPLTPCPSPARGEGSVETRAGAFGDADRNARHPHP